MSDVDLAFHLTLEQRIRAREIYEKGQFMAGPVIDYFVELGFCNKGWFTTEAGNLTWKLSGVHTASQQGMTYHDWFTDLVVASTLEGAARLGFLVPGFLNDLRGIVQGWADMRATGGTAKAATANVRKFSEYIFKDDAAPGKDVVFKNLGYSANDSELLTKIYREQAAANYSSGNYALSTLDNYGQRINIEIELPGVGGAAGKTSYINSGWMIKADGAISLNTPFSGFTK